MFERCHNNNNDLPHFSADDTGRISIWNIAPVANAKDEADENIPKMLCLLDNHSGINKI